MKPLPLVLVLGMAAMMNRCAPEKREAARPSDLAAKISRFAPADVSADLTRLSPGDRQALQKLVEAAGIMDKIYYVQSWNPIRRQPGRNVSTIIMSTAGHGRNSTRTSPSLRECRRRNRRRRTIIRTI